MANNGNVQSQTITVPGMTYPLVQSYSYDEVNRLSSAVERAIQPRRGNRNSAMIVTGIAAS
ncbi:MAG: hypothetical protein DYH05_08775 [Acidobacteria bacterium ACB1]|nr:hypothetical protein [Acidobacteria bacterium ACB1]RIJ94215.1 MAG: hypothetical protein DCC44_05105 [Acidobacteriota bacterium]